MHCRDVSPHTGQRMLWLQEPLKCQLTSNFWMQQIIMTLWLKQPLNSRAPSGLSGFRAQGGAAAAPAAWGAVRGCDTGEASTLPEHPKLGNPLTGKELQGVQDCQIEKKGSLGCKILNHLLSPRPEETLDKGKQGKKERGKLPPNTWFEEQALGSNLGQRFKSVLYLDQFTQSWLSAFSSPVGMSCCIAKGKKLPSEEIPGNLPQLAAGVERIFPSNSDFRHFSLKHFWLEFFCLFVFWGFFPLFIYLRKFINVPLSVLMGLFSLSAVDPPGFQVSQFLVCLQDCPSLCWALCEFCAKTSAFEVLVTLQFTPRLW